MVSYQKKVPRSLNKDTSHIYFYSLFISRNPVSSVLHFFLQNRPKKTKFMISEQRSRVPNVSPVISEALKELTDGVVVEFPPKPVVGSKGVTVVVESENK